MENGLFDSRDCIVCLVCEQYVKLAPIRFRTFLYDQKFSLDKLLQRIFHKYEFLVCERCCEELLAIARSCYNDHCSYCLERKDEGYFPFVSFLEYGNFILRNRDSSNVREYINYRCFDICIILKDIYTAINSKNWAFIDKLEYRIEEHLLDDYYLDKYETAFSAVTVPISFPRTIPRPIDKIILLIKAIKFDINVKKIEYLMKNVNL